MNLLNFSLIVVTVFIVTAEHSQAGVIPADIEKCDFEDGICLKERIQLAINKYATTGIRSLNLIPFDPLRINRLKLAKNPDSPVSINLDFENIDLIGLKNANLHSVTGFDAALKKPVEFKAFVPKLTLKGHYEVDGRVLILPIVGKGASEIILDNMDIIIRFKAKLVTKADKKYLEITGMQLLIDPKKVTFNLQGLFGQNKELGDNMVVFLNENWQDIFRELQPDIQDALSKIFKQMFNNIYNTTPYNELFKANEN